MSPQLIFGTAMFGMDQTELQDESAISTVLDILGDGGVKRLDSGARYPPLYPGRAEELIGKCKKQASGFMVDTKVYTDTKTDGSGDLTAEAIEKSVSGSLARLQHESEGVNVLHIHRADPSTPVAEQVRAFNEQIKKGRCKAWGVSNVPIPMLEEMFKICEEEGLQKPACYQGEYNIITRGVETTLLPLLRKHGVGFNAFRPLASGFMTGKFVKGDHEGTRFGDDSPLGKFAQKLFGADDLHAAMKKFDDSCTKHDIRTIEVAVRWAYYHSALKDQDGIVFGASKTAQIKEFIAMVQKGPLSPEVLQSAEELWQAVQGSRGSIF